MPPAASAAVAAVELRNVTAGWIEGRPVINDLSLSVPPSGVTRLSGRNGTGKSTLVELMSGYLHPWQGAVLIDGHRAQASQARDQRKVVRTQPRLFGDMLVEDHLRFFARTAGLDDTLLFEAAEALGLAPFFGENGKTLSAGTAKKLWYVLCSAGSPRVLILDEPFNAVDLPGIETLVADIGFRATQSAVVLISHAVPDGLALDHEISLDAQVAS